MNINSVSGGQVDSVASGQDQVNPPVGEDDSIEVKDDGQ